MRENRIWTLYFKCRQTIRCSRIWNDWRLFEKSFTLIPSSVLISKSYVPLLLVFLLVSVSSTWFESDEWDWNDCERTSKSSWCWKKKKVNLFITGEIVFRQDDGKLTFDIDVFDLNLWSKLILSKNQSSTISGYMSHRLSVFNYHLDYRSIVFINVQQDVKFSSHFESNSWIDHFEEQL